MEAEKSAINTAEALYQEAKSLIKAQKFDVALDALDRSLAVYRLPGALHDKAIIFHLMGNSESALSLLQETVAIDPAYAQAYDNISRIIVQTTGDMAKAIEYISLAIQAAPKEPLYKDNFIQLIGHLDFKLFSPEIKQLIIDCLETDKIEHDRLARPWHSLLMKDPAFKPVHSLIKQKSYRAFSRHLVKEKDLSVLVSPYFIQGLSRIFNADPSFELFLTHLRHFLLEERDFNLPSKLELMQALSLYCFRTGYIFNITEEEQEWSDELYEKASKEPTETDITLLACYFPIVKLPNKKNLSSASPLFLKTHLTDPVKDQECEGNIAPLTDISAGVSAAVREQYEEFPYPRWSALGQEFAVSINLEREIKSILIAGCGTGKEALQFAKAFPKAEILAIDISLASLSYAIRKAQEHDIDNVSFMQADILNLGSTNRKFDLISSSGVIHHMEDPLAGWQTLLGLLKNDGYLQLGLYSEIARRHVVAGQNAIKAKGYGDTLEEIRRFRQDCSRVLKKKDLTPLLSYRDFYTAPECRDLLFHVQEHRFTLPQISDTIERLNCVLIAFNLQLPVKSLYLASFPQDQQVKNIDDLAQFEENNPDSFLSMYNFWTRKKS